MATTKREKLFTEFPPVSTEQWEEVIKADLKGADYERKLVWKTPEGFNVRPYYRAENLAGLKFLAPKPGFSPTCGAPVPTTAGRSTRRSSSIVPRRRTPSRSRSSMRARFDRIPDRSGDLLRRRSEYAAQGYSHPCSRNYLQRQ